MFLSLWSFEHISYIVVITRLQVAESSTTSSKLFVSCVQQYKQQRLGLLNALAGNKEYVQMRSIAETGKDGPLAHTATAALVVG